MRRSQSFDRSGETPRAIRDHLQQASPELEEALELLSEESVEEPLTIDPPTSEDGRATNFPMPGNDVDANRVDLGASSGPAEDESAPRGQISDSRTLDVFERTVARNNDLNRTREDDRAGTGEQPQIVVAREVSAQSSSETGSSESATLVEAVFAGDSAAGDPSKTSGDPEDLPPSATSMANESGELTQDQQRMADDLASRVMRDLPGDNGRIIPGTVGGDDTGSDSSDSLAPLDAFKKDPGQWGTSGRPSPSDPGFAPPGPGGEAYELLDPSSTRHAAAEGLDIGGYPLPTPGGSGDSGFDRFGQSGLMSGKGGGLLGRLFGKDTPEVNLVMEYTDSDGNPVSDTQFSDGTVVVSVRRKDGTETHTATHADGSTSTQERLSDGTWVEEKQYTNDKGEKVVERYERGPDESVSSTRTTTHADGSKTTETLDENGEVTFSYTAHPPTDAPEPEAPEAEQPPDEFGYDPERAAALGESLKDATGYKGGVQDGDIDWSDLHPDSVGQVEGGREMLYGDRTDGTRPGFEQTEPLTPGNHDGNIDWGPDAIHGTSTGPEQDVNVPGEEFGVALTDDSENPGGTFELGKYYGGFRKTEDDDDVNTSLTDAYASKFDDD